MADVSEDSHQDVRKATPEEAAETDLGLVAEANGWTLDEARQARATADRLGELQATLMANHGNTFAGAYLSEEPNAPPTIRFVGGVPAKAREAIVAPRRFGFSGPSAPATSSLATSHRSSRSLQIAARHRFRWFGS